MRPIYHTDRKVTCGGEGEGVREKGGGVRDGGNERGIEVQGSEGGWGRLSTVRRCRCK